MFKVLALRDPKQSFSRNTDAMFVQIYYLEIGNIDEN